MLSFCIVALGQPARLKELCPLAAVLGFALFFTLFEASSRKKERFWISTLWFFLVQLVQLSWMTSIAFQGYYILFVYFFLCLGLGMQFGLLAIFLKARMKFLSLFALASFWTLLEWSRVHLLCGFSWNPIGLALAFDATPMQGAALFGVFGLSFWVMASNLCALKCFREDKRFFSLCVWITMAAFPYLFGAWHLFYHGKCVDLQKNALSIGIVQTGLLPSEKILMPRRLDSFIPIEEQWENIIGYLEERKEKWDLLVFPEAVVPLHADLPIYPFEAVCRFFIQKKGEKAERFFPPLSFPFAQKKTVNGQEKIYATNLFWAQTLSNLYNAEILLGLDHWDRERDLFFNSAFLLSPYAQNLQRYDKRVLLPLAEYLPFEGLRSLTKSYGICDFFSKGTSTRPLKSASGKSLSVSICYEETFSEAIRKTTPPESDFLVNLTNDNYYPNSLLPEQHFVHARLRTVENGRPLLRSCNTGVTAVIDSLGRVVARFGGPGEEFKRGVLACTLVPYKYSTFFSLWGDAGIIFLSFGLVTILFVISFFQGMRIWSFKLFFNYFLKKI
ncbi:MAG TPA: apolipoprotein N-acyltransferase [Rhabdochlamydiaceae bacterium]